MAKTDIELQSNQLNLTVVALVALVAIVGVVALVLYTSNAARGVTLSSAQESANEGIVQTYPVVDAPSTAGNGFRMLNNKNPE